MRLRTSEWITLGYFAYLACAAVAVRLPSARRRWVTGTAAVVVTSVLGLASFEALAVALRDWAPLVYLLLGYWLPVLFVTTTSQAFERTLLALDRRWFGVSSLNTVTERTPRALIELLELAYLCCYPLVPAGLACLYVSGLRQETDRFWTAVLLAVFSCYGVLPWLSTRPPRVIEAERGPTRSSGFFRRANVQVLQRASIQLNTFPSGHVAASLATALAVGASLPIAGLVLVLLALGISVASVVGRYHYAADALAGVALALAAFVISRFV